MSKKRAPLCACRACVRRKHVSSGRKSRRGSITFLKRLPIVSRNGQPLRGCCIGHPAPGVETPGYGWRTTPWFNICLNAYKMFAALDYFKWLPVLRMTCRRINISWTGEVSASGRHVRSPWPDRPYYLWVCSLLFLLGRWRTTRPRAQMRSRHRVCSGPV